MASKREADPSRNTQTNSHDQQRTPQQAEQRRRTRRRVLGGLAVTGAAAGIAVAVLAQNSSTPPDHAGPAQTEVTAPAVEAPADIQEMNGRAEAAAVTLGQEIADAYAAAPDDMRTEAPSGTGGDLLMVTYHAPSPAPGEYTQYDAFVTLKDAELPVSADNVQQIGITAGFIAGDGAFTDEIPYAASITRGPLGDSWEMEAQGIAQENISATGQSGESWSYYRDLSGHDRPSLYGADPIEDLTHQESIIEGMEQVVAQAQRGAAFNGIDDPA